MSGTQGEPITQLLDRLKGGDRAALDTLIPLVYGELRRMAGSYLRGERLGHTLQPTALVHEAYLRLAGQDHPDYQSRAHFYGVASQIMRQVLVDFARRRKAAKRTDPDPRVTILKTEPGGRSGFDIVAAVDDALKTLEQQDKLKARLIEMRFFGGLTAEESAGLLNLPVQTVRRQLRVGQAWLQTELDQPA
jgi:RNA polymerase sigma factor (TIGR02999 family)